MGRGWQRPSWLHTATSLRLDDAAALEEDELLEEELLGVQPSGVASAAGAAAPTGSTRVWGDYDMGSFPAGNPVPFPAEALPPGSSVSARHDRIVGGQDPAVQVWQTSSGVAEYLGSPANPHQTEHTDNRALFMLYVSGGYLDRAEELLAAMRRAGQTLGPDHFVSLIEGWLNEEKYLRAQRVFTSMLADGIKPTARAYALMLMTHHRRGRSQALKQLHLRAREDNISSADLMSSVAFGELEWNELYEALQLCEPEFVHSPEEVADVKAARNPALHEQWENEAAVMVMVDLIRTDAEEEALAAAKVKAEAALAAARRKAEAQGREFVVPEQPAGDAGALDGLQSPYVFSLWRQQVIDALERDRDAFLAYEQRNGKAIDPDGHRRSVYGRYLYNSQLPLEDLADIVLATLDRYLFGNEYGARLIVITKDIGRQLYKRYFTTGHRRRRLSTKLEKMYERYIVYCEDPVMRKQYTPAEYWALLRRKLSDTVDDQVVIPPWSVRRMVEAASGLLNIALEAADVSAVPGCEEMDEPAFYHTFDFDFSKRVAFIRAHPAVDLLPTNAVAMAATAHNKGLPRAFEASNLPTLVPPKPLTSVKDSPYLITPSSIIRCGDDAFQHYALMVQADHMLGEVYDALNALSVTPWAVNTRVLDLAKQYYRTGEALEDLDIPAEDIPLPDKPGDLFHCDETVKMEYLKVLREAKLARAKSISMRADMCLRLSVAERLRDKVFYQPHNLDFRGRAYVIAPYLNHLGGDLARAVLRFGETRPLGERGLRWLKIHLANVYGRDKLPFDERVKFTESSLEDVFDTADNPDGPPRPGHEKKWWLTADKPWQTLSTCLELAAALRSGDPEGYESSLPVHQDGTCNGLQHYAALGGDVEGAWHVNLIRTDQDRPQDLYTVTAQKVSALIEEHARGDFSQTPDLTESEARWAREMSPVLVDLCPIGRKLIKQTVMTTVYGVTFVGARDQILKQIRADKLIDPEHAFTAANYLATLVFLSLGHMFSGAQAIQKWLNHQARMIASAGQPVSWVTPMGLPIIQPYHKPGRVTIPTTQSSLTVKVDSNPFKPPLVSKQRSAFPPNYVHSLDATHMMYTANACQKEGLCFVSVHDSYWTHAGTIDSMNQHLREQFVRLYSQPLLQQLHHSFQMQYGGLPLSYYSLSGTLTIDPPPRAGNLDVKEVLDSPYFFN